MEAELIGKDTSCIGKKMNFALAHSFLDKGCYFCTLWLKKN